MADVGSKIVEKQKLEKKLRESSQQSPKEGANTSAHASGKAGAGEASGSNSSLDISRSQTHSSGGNNSSGPRKWDISSVMYHTVHGADAEKMAEALRLERANQRKVVTARAMRLRHKLTQQRHDMRHLRPSKHVELDDISMLFEPQEGHRGHTGSNGPSSVYSSNTQDWGQDETSDVDYTSTNQSTRDSAPSSWSRTLRLRSRRSHHHREHKSVDILEYPGWSATSLTSARSTGKFQVFT